MTNKRNPIAINETNNAEKRSKTENSSTMTISLPACDDFHLHLRDGAVTESVLPSTIERFRRAIVMPNLKPPVTTTKEALAYRERIMDAVKRICGEKKSQFQPLMTLYLTDKTPSSEIVTAKESGIVFGVKLYPAGATTNSDNGVTDIKSMYPVLRTMAEVGMPLLIHSEVTDPTVDIFDREHVFIERILKPLVPAIPNLKIVMEHMTTKAAVDFVLSMPDRVAGTITAHHLLYNRSALFVGGLRPHYYCLPVLKTESDRQALVQAAISGNPKFFAGTDSAPHARQNKERGCCSAGCYTSFASLELYTEAFDNAGALDKLKNFLCRNGAVFYGLPAHTGNEVTLVREKWQVPGEYPLGDDKVVPFRANETMQWKITHKL